MPATCSGLPKINTVVVFSLAPPQPAAKIPLGASNIPRPPPPLHSQPQSDSFVRCHGGNSQGPEMHSKDRGPRRFSGT